MASHQTIRDSIICIGSSDVEVVEDSEPERQAAAARLKSLASGPSTSTSSSTTVSKAVASRAATSEDSDIELVSVKEEGRAKAKSKRKANVGGFTTATAILKDEKRKAKSTSPHFENPPRSLDKGKGRAKAEEEDQPDFDDELIELPPPLRAAKAVKQPQTIRESPGELDGERHASASSDSDVAVSSFRKHVSYFKAPGGSRQGSISGSLHALDSGRSKGSSSGSLGRASSVSDACSATEVKPKAARARVNPQAPPKPPALVVATDLLNVMTRCPMCELNWTTSSFKTSNAKLLHLRKCASAKGYREDTVVELSFRQVKELQDERDEFRRQAESNKTLFENVLSKKGKDVLVVGVEEKRNKPTSAPTDLPGGGGATILPKPAVLYTQGGSAHSQATYTQVQREIDTHIKVNKKVDRGDFISLLKPDREAVASNIAPNAIGSKQWQKAAQLLAAKAAGIATDTPGTSGSVVNKSTWLESYTTSRFRLAEKAKRMIDSRSASSASSASEDNAEQVLGADAQHNGDFKRKYRHIGDGIVSLADHAIASSRSRTYDLWSMACSETDTGAPRLVTSPSPAHSSPPRPATHASSTTGISPVFSRVAITTASASATSPTSLRQFSTTSSNALSASSAALDSLIEKMKATSNSSRSTASAALRKAREHKKGELSLDAPLVEEQVPVDKEPSPTPRRRRSSQASESSVDIPIAALPGATPPSRRHGRPRKSLSPDLPGSTKSSPKRPLPVSSEDGEGHVKAGGKAKSTTQPRSRTAEDRAKSAVSPKKRAKQPAVAATAAMPDYASWERPALQAETGKYGYKPSASKTVLVGQLTRIWEALHPGQVPASASKSAATYEGEASDETAAAASPKKKVGRPRKAASPELAAAKPKVVRKRAPKAKVAEDDVDIDSDPEDLRTAGEKLREAVLADEAFYLRILRYEPICFTDFEAIASNLRVKISKVALRDWLDSQAIIFYYPQDTGRNAKRNGARKRHP